MKRLLLLIIVLLGILFTVNALTFDNVTVTSVSSNTSIYFDEALNVNELIIGDNFVFLDSANVDGVCNVDVNYSTPNQLNFSSQLMCPFTPPPTFDETEQNFKGFMIAAMMTIMMATIMSFVAVTLLNKGLGNIYLDILVALALLAPVAFFLTKMALGLSNFLP